MEESLSLEWSIEPFVVLFSTGRLDLLSLLPNSFAILCNPRVGVFLTLLMSNFTSAKLREDFELGLVLFVVAGQVDGEVPQVETVPAVDRKPFISLLSFCRFFLPPGPKL